jgi:hypothetical protein
VPATCREITRCSISPPVSTRAQWPRRLGRRGHGGGEERAPTLRRVVGWGDREQRPLLGAVLILRVALRSVVDASPLFECCVCAPSL